MDFLILLLTLFSFIFIKVILTIFQVGKPKNLPPSPTPLPIIGHLHLVGSQPHQSLAKLAEIHGPIMSLKLGSIKTLVISSSTAVKEVLQKQDLAFCDRFVPDALHEYSIYSVGWLPVGTKWRSLRKILHTILSANQLENNANQHLRNQKVQELVAYCQKASQSNNAVDIGRAAFRTTLNLVSNTIFSKDLTDPYEDSGKEFKQLLREFVEEAATPNLVDYFPIFKKIDPQGIRRRMKNKVGKVLEILEGLINERLNLRKLKQGSVDNNDALDACLDIIEQNPEGVDRSDINILFMDLILAGTDTNSSTIEWAMTEVLRNPHTMIKAKKELEDVLGKGKIVEHNDAMRLPYLNCIIKETLRIHPPTALLPPRKVKTQVDINGYTIPEGTQVFINAWAIGRDSTLWEDPLTFKPERFMTSQIDVRGQDFELIPFGGGRRRCPGLELAVRMLPMMLGSLLNNFVWKLDGGKGPESLDMTEKFGVTLEKAYPLRAIPVLLS